jgi:GTP:adenosylcobinamide-phosphate guanylyltransferase
MPAQAQFDLRTVAVTEFGVGIDDAKGQRFVLIPIDADVQAALREMVITTREKLKLAGETSTIYDPSEKHAGREHLHLPLDDELAGHVRAIHDANNLPSEPSALANPEDVFCYFARMSDGKGHRLTAVRRATTFKGVLKSRFLRLTTDALKIVQDKMFKLDHDFDLLIDETGVEILRPAGFEFIGDLEKAILGAVSKNIKAIKADLPFVNFTPIEAYAAQHPRAARYLASIRAQQETKNIDRHRLTKLCKITGVKVSEHNGALVVDEDSIMDFLGVIDRRLYWVELVKGTPESFRAASRSKIVVSIQSGGTP